MPHPPSLTFAQQAVDDLFPLHVLLDAEGRVKAMGPTMQLILGDGKTGAAFFDLFQIEKPRRVKTIDDMLRHGRKSLTITLRESGAETLDFRCIASQIGENGCLLIDFALGSNMIAAIERFQLNTNHFKANDFSVDLFYSFQTQRALLEDSQKLSTKLSEAKEAAERAANIDLVTGVASRRALQLHLRHLADTGQTDVTYALLQIDLDRFKAVNDTFGHMAGDSILRHAAAVIAAWDAPRTFAARLGGDEFVLLVEDPPERDVLLSQARDLAAAISRPTKYKDQSYSVGASIGITQFVPAQIQFPEQPLLEADIALYAAKDHGIPVVHVTPEMMAEHARREDLIREIEAGILRDEFIPFFQPQIDSQTGKIIGAEVLARWQHPTLGILTPAHWMDEAKRANLMATIDHAVMHQAITQFQAWRAAGHGIEKLSLNLTFANLCSDSFAEDMSDTLFSAGIPNDAIQFELLESILIDQNDPRLIKRCEALVAAGFQLALDDFGTGHAAISTLIDTPISMLKIDRSFVTGLDQNPKLQRITRAIMAMSEQIGLDVIAEGVETQQELDLITSYGCQKVQGYFFAAPLSATAFEDWLNPKQPQKAASIG